MDDVIILGSTVDELLIYIELFLQEIKKSDMKLKRDKLKIGFDKIKFLGNILTKGEIRPDPGKINDIVNMKKPETLTKLGSFLRMVNYLSQFVKGSAIILSQLLESTKGFKANKKDAKIEFNFLHLFLLLY